MQKMIINKLKRSKGKYTYCLFAKLYINDNRPVNLTYDVLNDNLVIHKWWRLGEAESIVELSDDIKSALRSIG